MTGTRRDVLKWFGAGVAGALEPFGRAGAAPRSSTSRDRPAPKARVDALPPLPRPWQTVGYAVLGDGRLAILGTDADLRREWRRDGDGKLLGHPDEIAASASARLWTFDGDRLVLETSFPLLNPLPRFDRFPDGRWLVAKARAEDEANGRILAPDGSELGRVRLGDGIQHLKIDDRGRIWVGWFDEGVSGNDGWRVGADPRPPSSYGLCAFDEAGAVVAKAEAPSESSAIADCYALNVAAGTAWACTYMDFPILACRPGGGSRWWPSDLSGTDALAVRAPYALAAGGYGEDGNKAVLVRLGEGRARALGEWRLPVRVGYPNLLDLFDGRGEVLHAVQDGRWHRWRIADFIAAAG